MWKEYRCVIGQMPIQVWKIGQSFVDDIGEVKCWEHIKKTTGYKLQGFHQEYYRIEIATVKGK